MTFLGCAGSEELEGANFTPPTLGEFMKNEKAKELRFREARAGAFVVKEARLFHEKQAQKHGLHTQRGSAHLRAARMFSREAGASLQERLESFNSEMGEINPKALAKATKDTINFHQKMAKKHGLDSDLGHAHTAQMEQHMDTLNKLKQSAGKQQPEVGDGPMDSGGKGVATHKQKPQQVSGEESYEGGPGSGPRKGMTTGGTHEKNKTQTQYKKGPSGPSERKMFSHLNSLEIGTGGGARYGPDEIPKLLMKKFGIERSKANRIADKYWGGGSPADEAIPGKSGKMSPVPVPKKSQMPNNDIKQNKPPIDLDAQQGGGRRLQQNESRRPRRSFESRMLQFTSEARRRLRRG